MAFGGAEMTDPRLIERLAKSKARSLQAKFSEFCDTTPVSIDRVADALGYRVVKRPGLEQRAILEWVGEPRYPGRILIASGLGADIERFSIAHELGHGVLIAENQAGELPTPLRELFANRFAAELLVPIADRDDIVQRFRSLETSRDLLSLARKLGLSPYALLYFLWKDQRAFSNIGRVWLRAGVSPNKRSSLEPKLRILQAFFDRKEVFLATNQGLSRCVDPIPALSLLMAGEERTWEGSLTIQARSQNSDTAKYISKTVSANFTAVAVTHGSSQTIVYYILGRFDQE